MVPGSASVDRDDRVLPWTRCVAYVIVPFLVVAFAVLYPWPSDACRLFAWEIKPTITSMVLGSAYLGGAYYFIRAAWATGWHTIKGGFAAVGVFASLMGVSTIVHWDRFEHDRLAFWLWVALYFTTPFLILGVWLRNRRHDAPTTTADLLLPVPAARVIAAVGALALTMGLFLFLLPSQAIAVWPWPLTPLTARVLGAIFCLGLAGLGVLLDRRWSSARIPLQVAGVMLVLILLAAGRAYAQFDPANLLTWLMAAGFVGLMAAMAVLYRHMENRTRLAPLPDALRWTAAGQVAGRAVRGRREYDDIDYVVARMRADLVQMQEQGDARRFFHATYLRTTEAVASEIAQGGFADAEWVREWDLVFAGLYLDALDADSHGEPVPHPWRVAFDAARNQPDLPALRHVLLGINAHFNYDLPQALIAVISSADFDEPDLLRRREADHQHLDAVLQARVGAEDAELNAVSTVTLIDRLLRPANRAASRRFLTEARKKVWHNAIALDQARRAGAQQSQDRLAELERLCAARLAVLSAPGPVLLKLARYGFGVTLQPVDGRITPAN